MPSKQRIPSKCKQWEKDRRDRFNKAIDELGEIVKSERKKNIDCNDEFEFNITKIEIIQEAIKLLKNYVDTRSQLNSEVLALKSKIEKYENGNGFIKARPSKSKTPLSFHKIAGLRRVSEPKLRKKMNIKSIKFRTSSKVNVNTTKLLKKDFLNNNKETLKLPILMSNVINQSNNLLIPSIMMPPFLIPPTPIMILQPNILTNSKKSISIMTRTSSISTKTTMINKVPIPSCPLTIAGNKSVVKNNKAPKKKMDDIDLKKSENENTKTGGKQNDENSISKSPASNADNIKDCLKNKDLECGEQAKIKENYKPSIDKLKDNQTVIEQADGNTRLELAEELLASSPTAVFLTQFPLVSGMRTDSPTEHMEQNNSIQSNTGESNRNNVKSNFVQCNEKQCKANVSVKDKPLFNSSVKPNDKSRKIENRQKDTKVSYNSAELNQYTKTVNTPSNSMITTVASSTASLNIDPFVYFDIDTKSQTNQNAAQNPIISKYDCNVSNTNLSANQPLQDSTFNLYPCALEKYTDKSSKTDCKVYEDCSKLNTKTGFEIDFNLSQKYYDFVPYGNSNLSSNNYIKEVTVPSVVPNTYNNFSSDFYLNLTSSSVSCTLSKRNNSKGTNDTPSYMYSQPTMFWPEETPARNSSLTSTPKQSSKEIYPTITEIGSFFESNDKTPLNYKKQDKTPITEQNYFKKPTFDVAHLVTDKTNNLKKSPRKSHVNWMTSEIFPMRSDEFNFQIEQKLPMKNFTGGNSVHNPDSAKKHQEFVDQNIFTFPVTNLAGTHTQDDVGGQQFWPPNKTLQVSEFSLETPSLNLPTLVADFALSSDKKKSNETQNPGLVHDNQGAGSFLSVSQLVDKSNEMNPWLLRPHNKKTNGKIDRESAYMVHDKVECNQTYVYDNGHRTNFANAEYVTGKPFTKTKSNSHINCDKESKQIMKNNIYSAESLIKENTNQRSMKKSYDNCKHLQDIPQISHYPPILDHNESTNYSQQFPSNIIYNSSTVPTTFYSNYMPSNPSYISNYNTTNYVTESFDCMSVEQNHLFGGSNYKNKFQADSLPFKPNISENNIVTAKESKHKSEGRKDPYKTKNKKMKLNYDSTNNYSKTIIENTLTWYDKNTKKYGDSLNENVYMNYSQNQHINPSFFPSSSEMSANNNTFNTTISNRTNFNLSNLFPEISQSKHN